MCDGDATDRTLLDHARKKVEAPAVALLLSSVLSLLALLIGLAFSAWLLVSGVKDDMQQPPGACPQKRRSSFA